MLASVAALGRDGFGLRLVSGLMAAASVPLVALTAEASDKKYVRNIYIYREREREWPGLELVERKSRCLLSAGQVLRAGRRDPAGTRSMSRKFP